MWLKYHIIVYINIQQYTLLLVLLFYNILDQLNYLQRYIDLLNFEHGKLISPQGHTEKRADLSLIELKTNERFEVPDAIIYGG